MASPIEELEKEILKIKHWNADLVISMILRLHKLEYDLSDSNVRKRVLKLRAAAKSYFGSWPKAIDAAGLDYSEILRLEHWDKERVLSELATLNEAGFDLNPSNILKKYNALYSAAQKYFEGGYREAVETLDLRYEHVLKVKLWSKEKVIDAIRRLHSRNVDLSRSNIEGEYPKLYYAGRYHFDSWKHAIAAAGFDYGEILKVRQWNEEKVISEIQRLFRAGKDISYSSVNAKYPYLIGAARRIFKLRGGYGGAVQAAGIDYNDILKHIKWNREKTLTELKALIDAGIDASPANLQTNYRGLYKAILKHVGHLNEAYEILGVSKIVKQKEVDTWKAKTQLAVMKIRKIQLVLTPLLLRRSGPMNYSYPPYPQNILQFSFAIASELKNKPYRQELRELKLKEIPAPTITRYLVILAVLGELVEQRIGYGKIVSLLSKRARAEADLKTMAEWFKLRQELIELLELINYKTYISIIERYFKPTWEARFKIFEEEFKKEVRDLQNFENSKNDLIIFIKSSPILWSNLMLETIYFLRKFLRPS